MKKLFSSRNKDRNNAKSKSSSSYQQPRVQPSPIRVPNPPPIEKQPPTLPPPKASPQPPQSQSSTFPPPPPPTSPPPRRRKKNQSQYRSSPSKSPTSYRKAIQEYHRTINPDESNSDGFGGRGVLGQEPTSGLRTTTIPLFAMFSEESAVMRMRNRTPWRHEDEERGGTGSLFPMGQSSARRRVAAYPLPTVMDGESVVSCSTVGGKEDGKDLEQQKGGNSFEGPSHLEMPDATYEETYGDGYVGEPIRYIYPSGYQNMRPRSGPWKLSLFVFALFIWMTIFIVGHCSDRVDADSYGNIDDDALRIETRWCGSRLLYCMWLVSVIITGISAAYCSIIGYIKLRDFAVANCRSQPPGMNGKSDYYVRIGDNGTVKQPKTGDKDDHYQHHSTIYQADGTPQFWGTHIYRPTQAAVAVTSR